MNDYRYRQPLPGLTSKRSKTPQPLFQTPYQFGRSSTGDHSSAVAMAREEALNKLCGSPKKLPPTRAYCPPSPSSSSSSSSSKARLPQHETHHPLYHHQRVEPPLYSSSSRNYKTSSNRSSAMHHHHHHYKQQHPRSSRPKAPLSSDDEDDDLPLIYTLSPPRSPLYPQQSPGLHPISQSLKKLSGGGGGAREQNRRRSQDDESSDDDGIPLADEMRSMMRVPK
ncbi:predicted protein [Lichtheimia corymbifera JMRC:FSU:9682]|uniref:Uncharacterized protein n=1 Tax=Lichtheimia corymbifera JMRC:FSU:9682 TaxID=1263082 RepID=A0A068S4U1_9FUNG|nr:predicted protein [Lichtheimia corymbifera JMRC:FSU:9682]